MQSTLSPLNMNHENPHDDTPAAGTDSRVKASPQRVDSDPDYDPTIDRKSKKRTAASRSQSPALAFANKRSRGSGPVFRLKAAASSTSMSRPTPADSAQLNDGSDDAVIPDCSKQEARSGATVAACTLHSLNKPAPRRQRSRFRGVFLQRSACCLPPSGATCHQSHSHEDACRYVACRREP
jgi:hypothetical protein